MHAFLVTLSVLGVIAAGVIGVWLAFRALVAAILALAIPVMAFISVMRWSRTGRIILDMLLRAGYLIPWMLGVGLFAAVLGTISILVGALFIALTAHPITTIVHVSELVFAVFLLPGLVAITTGIAYALRRAAKLSEERARLVRALLGAAIAFVIYGAAGSGETVALRLSVNSYFQGHLFDAATLAALVTFGWLLVPTERPERPPFRARLRAYGYFAAACACIAALGGYTAGGALGDVAVWACAGALTGWLLALGLIATRWEQRATAADQREFVTSRFTFRTGLPPEEVFRMLSDPAGHPAWAGGLVRVIAGPEPPAEGAAGREVWRILLWPVTADYTITAWDPGRAWASHAVARSLGFERRIELVPAGEMTPAFSWPLPGQSDRADDGTRIDVQLLMIGKGAWGGALKSVFGQPWQVRALGTQDRLRSLLGAPRRIEEDGFAHVNWKWPGEVLRRVLQPPAFLVRLAGSRVHR